MKKWQHWLMVFVNIFVLMQEVYNDPEKYYDQVLNLDLNKLEPYVNGPFTPDLATPISQMKAVVEEKWLASKIGSGIDR